MGHNLVWGAIGGVFWKSPEREKKVLGEKTRNGATEYKGGF